jgi:hypothetical protein
VSISSTLYAQIFRTKVLLAAFLYLRSVFVTKEKLLKALSYEKFAHKMLMKLTPVINKCQAKERGIAEHQKYTAVIAQNHNQTVSANLQ